MSAVTEKPTASNVNNCDNETSDDNEHDPHYDPIISLPEVVVPTLEEDESIMLSLRAKLYRYDANEDPPEWKERGTGNVKILRHKLHDTCRVVMRRDKTLKLCANHFITPHMSLKPSVSCDRAWVYSVKDYSDATVKSELLAIKFLNVENAEKWKSAFDEAKKIVVNHKNSKGEATLDDNLIIGESPKLSDTFEEEKKNSITEKKEENEIISSKKSPNPEVTEKLSSLSLKSS